MKRRALRPDAELPPSLQMIARCAQLQQRVTDPAVDIAALEHEAHPEVVPPNNYIGKMAPNLMLWNGYMHHPILWLKTEQYPSEVPKADPDTQDSSNLL